MTVRYFMYGPRRYNLHEKKNFFVYHFFAEKNFLGPFQTKTKPSCKFHENRSKKVAFGINGLIKLNLKG
jgi:hypothetical protein